MIMNFLDYALMTRIQRIQPKGSLINRLQFLKESQIDTNFKIKSLTLVY